MNVTCFLSGHKSDGWRFVRDVDVTEWGGAVVIGRKRSWESVCARCGEPLVRRSWV